MPEFTEKDFNLGKLLFQKHWASVAKEYPNEHVEELANKWEESDRVVQRTWTRTAKEFLASMSQ